jgi:hypothetical protein
MTGVLDTKLSGVREGLPIHRLQVLDRRASPLVSLFPPA